MFEAVVSLCLSLSGEPCRDQLLPGYEAPTQADCLSALVARPPDIEALAGLGTLAEPECKSAGPTLPIEEVAPGVFVHTGLIEEPDQNNRGDVANLGFIVGEASVAVIDSGSARWVGEALWRAIRTRTDKPVSHVILTHMHPDHVLGAMPLAQAGAEVVAHAGLPRALADRRANYVESLDRLIGSEAFLGTVPAVVTVPVEVPSHIDLGGRILDLRPWPTAHTGTDLTVFDRQSGTLFAGDLVFHRHTPALDGSLSGWQAALSEMSAMDVQRLVPGHGAAVLPWPDGGAAMVRYLAALERDTRAAIDRGERLGDAVTHIGSSQAENWELFEAYNPRNATVAFTELEWE